MIGHTGDNMKASDVTCPRCTSVPETPCKGGETHEEREDRARDWRRLFRLAEQLGMEGDPELNEAEFLEHFGDTPRERRLAREMLDLAEQLGYTEPGDQEAA